MGVTLMRTLEEEKVVAVAKISSADSSEKNEILQEVVVESIDTLNTEDDTSINQLLERAEEEK